MNSKKYYLYIITNQSDTLYIGVTSNLEKRVYQHKNKLIPGFTSKYNLNKLIYFEEYNLPQEAIAREKQIKKWNRRKKINLIKTINPKFKKLTS